ncbi:Crp/Fnr family transcriptional regulator [uncultured Sulfitobacter sp.]|uniref:Crp/Fnr family transcriptional regulator n=1 Tax=uncultured Sulfitobacter sp. TaxID=191468 RepID=UPI00261EA7A1|nr:Crp/Fnr family transcriptional regulator [uncultured Sulfitobacter sp.]
MTNPSLADVGFLSSASPALRKMFTALASRVKLPRGVTLFESGDQGDTLFAVISGEVEVSVTSREGQKLSLAILGPGELFGEIALFAPGPRTATVSTTANTEVWKLQNNDVLSALHENPALYLDMIELAGLRMRWMSAQYHEQVFMDVPTRLAHRVLHLSGPHLRELQMSHADLAAFVGATRETVSKTLSAWKQQNLIHMRRGTLTVLDAKALRNFAESGNY